VHAPRSLDHPGTGRPDHGARPGPRPALGSRRREHGGPVRQRLDGKSRRARLRPGRGDDLRHRDPDAARPRLRRIRQSAGGIYGPAPAAGRIQLFDATGAIVADTFAIGPDAPQAVAFGRDATGATVARLFATDPRVGRVFEVNPAGVAHPGQPVGYVAPRFPL